MGLKSVFQLAFLYNKKKRPHILDLSITVLDLSFEIQKSKIERVCLGEHDYKHSCSFEDDREKWLLLSQSSKIRKYGW
jgi:hypothetical protein